jgi:hypothetical protein
MIRILTEDECKNAIKKGEFDPSLLQQSALILTQSWCPQWAAMKSYLEKADRPELSILYIEYDQVPWFEDFRIFKEQNFDNREIPYVRYYKDGKCTAQSNYVSLEGFLRRLGME